MMNVFDVQLLNETESDNKHVYEGLFKQYYKPLVAQAFYMLKDEMEAEDLVQTLFIDLWQRANLQQVANLKPYLSRAVHNRCLNLMEKRKVADKKLTNYLQGNEFIQDDDSTETEVADKMITYMADLLPRKRLQALSLVYLENKKYKEAAKEMGISVNSIKTHLKLGLKTLQQLCFDKNKR